MSFIVKCLERLLRLIAKVTVNIYPRSPYYSAYTEVELSLFGTKPKVVDNFKVEVDSDGTINFEDLFRKAPVIHVCNVHYPEDWFEQIEELERKYPTE